MKPQNFEETIIWYAIIGTYLVYFLGIQYIAYPVLGWCLAVYVFRRIWQQTDDTPAAEQIFIPWGVWVWIFSMTVTLIALIIGHLDFELGTRQLLKSSFDQFPRTWGLFAIFPLVGCLRIRSQLIYRAACILCLQSLIYVIVGNLAYHLGINGHLYNTPFAKFAGGSSASDVLLYAFDEYDREFRLQLFTPFAPSLGVVGNVYFWLTCYEKQTKWRWIGIIASILMIWYSFSRTGKICMFVVPALIWFLANVRRPLVQLTAAATSFITSVFSYQIIYWIQDYSISQQKARAASTKIRGRIRRESLRRWWDEAPIWGHGMGDRTVGRFFAGKSIGSHGMWHGVLFVHGLVGLLAIVIPMICTAIDCLLKLHHNPTARIGLALMVIFAIYGFSENLEGQIYLFWPGMVMVGIALKETIPSVLPQPALLHADAVLNQHASPTESSL
ncbi:MAG: hypothetical protein KME16_11900 [Scytolyngbya sp. HA4215-MV1]|jgi:uncharacterized membrane protein|nr:hypothetical protein [Scytolyngbya sp. HA4215-MV1]